MSKRSPTWESSDSCFSWDSLRQGSTGPGARPCAHRRPRPRQRSPPASGCSSQWESGARSALSPGSRSTRSSGSRSGSPRPSPPGLCMKRHDPGEERRNPSLRSPTYAVRAPLANWLRAEASRAAEDFGRVRLLDVGCGAKPYEPLFASFAGEHVGVDVENPAAQLEGAVESLPVEDGSFQVVLCTQVLEHAADPARAVAELSRVTAPGGRVLASTHGVQAYHPNPDDFWRWTHAGLQPLFEQTGEGPSV